jgi:hypothetical protein
MRTGTCTPPQGRTPGQASGRGRLCRHSIPYPVCRESIVLRTGPPTGHATGQQDGAMCCGRLAEWENGGFRSAQPGPGGLFHFEGCGTVTCWRGVGRLARCAHRSGRSKRHQAERNPARRAGRSYAISREFAARLSGSGRYSLARVRPYPRPEPASGQLVPNTYRGRLRPGQAITSSHARRPTRRSGWSFTKRLLCLLSYAGGRLCAWQPIRSPDCGSRSLRWRGRGGFPGRAGRPGLRCAGRS